MKRNAQSTKGWPILACWLQCLLYQ